MPDKTTMQLACEERRDFVDLLDGTIRRAMGATEFVRALASARRPSPTSSAMRNSTAGS